MQAYQRDQQPGSPIHAKYGEHRNTPKATKNHSYSAAKKTLKTSVAAPVAQTSFYCRLQPLCLKRQCFAPSVPHNANGTFLQSLQWALQHHVTNAHAPMHAARCGKARRQQPCGRSNEICNQKKSTRAKYCEHAYTLKATSSHSHSAAKKNTEGAAPFAHKRPFMARCSHLT